MTLKQFEAMYIENGYEYCLYAMLSHGNFEVATYLIYNEMDKELT